MKTKPILIAVAVIVVVSICGVLFFRGKTTSAPKTDEIVQFLKGFKQQIVKHNNQDSLLSYFKENKKSQSVLTLVNTLTAPYRKDLSPEEFFNIDLEIDKAYIKLINSELVVATVPVIFKRDSMETRFSSITFTIHKEAEHQYKIYQVDARNFMGDYASYKNYMYQRTYDDKDIYSPATLKAFADVSHLFAKYDSVVWFGHVKEKAYFYVVKGKWDLYEGFESKKDTAKEYKMGLVGPDYNEIIPVEYDVVHNIGGTFAGMIEVEKAHKRGFYDLSGKVVLPVDYDQIFPVNDPENLAALKKGDDYYWLKNDYTVSEKVDLNMGDILAKLKQPGTFTLTKSTGDDITEFNSKNAHGTVYLPPSYLVDLNILPVMKQFKNPLRKHVMFDEASSKYEVKQNHEPVGTTNDNWFQSALYSVRDYFIGGRSEFYDTKNLVLVDKKLNKIYTTTLYVDESEEGGGSDITESCAKSSILALNDSLFQVKIQSHVSIEFYNGNGLFEIPYYHYLALKGGKLVELDSRRSFNFTQFQKMDDSFLAGCYVYGITSSANGAWKRKESNVVNVEALRFMKNEIYASYNYKFKDAKWNSVFSSCAPNFKPENASVDDSLTVIDKYNIAFINSKLNGKPLNVKKANSLALVK